MSLPVLDSSVAGKKVLVRGDIDVPLKNGAIADDTRLRGIRPTIDFLLQRGCEVTLCGHLGRPEGRSVTELSTKPIQEYFPEIRVLENLRFDPREEAGDPGLAKELAGWGEVYVNEAFAACERAHASIVEVAKLLPHFAGLRLAREIEVLSGLMENPKRPMAVIIGGAKLDTKLPVINSMVKVADLVIVGGKLLEEGGQLQKIAAESGGKVKMLELSGDHKDVVLSSIDRVTPEIQSAATLIWNGPVGVVEDFTYQVGSRRIAELVAASKAYKVLGGGDTVGFIDKLGLTNKFEWVSSGGGSMLKFLAGEKLPGIEVLLT